jgi:hypothetical protein
MPSQAEYAVSNVEPGGYFLAKRGIQPVKVRRSRTVPHETCAASSSARLPGRMLSQRLYSSDTVSHLSCVLPNAATAPEGLLEAADRENEELEDWCMVDMFADGGSEDMTPSQNLLLPGLWQVASPTTGSPVTASSTCAARNAWTEEVVPIQAAPQMSDGWHVSTHSITLRKKAFDPRRSSFKKKVKTAAKHSQFTKEHIENLLGDLADKPLGGSSEHEMKTPEETSPTEEPQSQRTTEETQRYPSQLSLSTFLFGASDIGNMSECGSSPVTSRTNSLNPSQFEVSWYHSQENKEGRHSSGFSSRERWTSGFEEWQALARQFEKRGSNTSRISKEDLKNLQFLTRPSFESDERRMSHTSRDTPKDALSPTNTGLKPAPIIVEAKRHGNSAPVSLNGCELSSLMRRRAAQLA